VVVDIFRDKGVASCTVTLEAERVQKAFEEAYNEAAQNLKVPGFRRGKAPISVVRSRLDRKSIRNQVLERLMPEAVKECLERYDLKPMGRPSLENYSLEEGSEFVLQLSLVERPEVKLGDYKGLEVSLPEAPDPKQKARDMLEELRKAQVRLLPKEGEVEEGEVVEVHLEYWLDGSLRMVREKAHLDLGEPGLNKALREGLIGAKVGDERELDEEPGEEKAGPVGRYKIKMKAVLRKEVPELTAEWVKARYGKESIEALLQEIEEEVASRSRQEAHEEIKERLLRDASNRAEAEVPAYSTIRLASSRLATFVEELRERGFSLDEKGAKGPASVEQVFSDILEKSREAIKERLVVYEIAQGEGIEVTEEEVHQRLHQLRPEMAEDDPDRDALMGRVESDMLRGKVADFLYANAVVKPLENPASE